MVRHFFDGIREYGSYYIECKKRIHLIKMITVIHENLFSLIRRSVWQTGTVGYVDWPLFEEMREHAIAALPAGILSQLEMPDDLRRTWQMGIYEYITYQANYRAFQAALPVTVPYVILKGTAAAKYYPNPALRGMGDIDIMPGREDHQAACDMLLQNGFRETFDEVQEVRGRHRSFSKDSFLVEVHGFYAHKNDPEKAKYVDDLIIGHINASHELPDPVNGIVLLEHINHHMEYGLGLRQIIDWMMYVNACLPDEKWPAFQQLAQRAGLEKLAEVSARMCEIYLGLPQRKWCSGAAPELCGRLMEHILANGNFGRKQAADSSTSASFFSSSRTLKGTLQFLQGRGLVHWKAAQKYRILRPFAWLYQVGRYLKKGLGRKSTVNKLRAEYEDGKKRNDLFDALEVSREKNGFVIYKDGKYCKL